MCVFDNNIFVITAVQWIYFRFDSRFPNFMQKKQRINNKYLIILISNTVIYVNDGVNASFNTNILYMYK